MAEPTKLYDETGAETVVYAPSEVRRLMAAGNTTEAPIATPDPWNGLDRKLIDGLIAAEFDTPEKAAEAEDAALLAVKGIGEKGLAAIREALK